MKRLRTLQTHGNGAAPNELSPWFHNLHLPDGSQTAPDHPLGDFPRWKWEEFAGHVPEDLSGARALDIGCNAGFYTFELARRGAQVTAIDIDAHYLRQAAWAADRFGLSEQIAFRQMAVYDLARVDVTPYDVVLFMGVLYHLRHPLLALDIVAEKTGGRLVVQTLTLPGEERLKTPADLPIDERERMRAPGWPSMAFIEHELAGDPTNWWAPDAACVEAVLRSCGLSVVAHPGHEIWVCEPGPRSAWAADQIAGELRSATGTSRHAAS
jgi:tRNA (mo5U34)-methyltransferase